MREQLSYYGITVEMCGPCNKLTYASTERDWHEFWEQHPDCEWDWHHDRR